MDRKFNGALFGLAAFAAWGLLPAYWKQLGAVNAFEILCHRIVWSCVFLLGIIAFQKRWHELKTIIQNPAALKGLVLSGILIGFNWFIYIWAVNSGRVVETSLGYYMNPMLNVVMGYLLLGERFSRLQSIAVFFAMAGVAAANVGSVFVCFAALLFDVLGTVHLGTAVATMKNAGKKIHFRVANKTGILGP